VLTPQRMRPAADAIDDTTISRLRAVIGSQRVLVWLYTPMMNALADAFAHAPVVFDKMDELANFANADPRLRAREDALLARATVVFAGGRSLFRSVEGRTDAAFCYPSGVDVQHFGQARTLRPHSDLQRFRGSPVFGYIGVIDERLDLALLEAVCAARRDAIVVLVGPTAKIDAAILPQAPNLVYLGKRSYDELPALLAGFDVALMPFALNEHTRNISPTKTLEYLAAGRRVVSTAVPDIVADHGDVVSVAESRERFIALLAEVSHRDDLHEERVRRKVRAASWDAIVAAMLRDLRDYGITLSAGGVLL
jgi:UDP-galactopyranose mutase